MADYIESLQRLSECFGRLPGIGRKTAMRLAFSVVGFSKDDVEEFANAMKDAKSKIHMCPVCCNLTDKEMCSICADSGRDKGVICVVEDVRSLMSIEKVREYKGSYHVLHGVISPMTGVGPEKIHLQELLRRLESDDVREVIVATNPTVEGEATAMYIARLLKPLGVKVTRIACGMPAGGDLEYADEITLTRAIEGRKEV